MDVEITNSKDALGDRMKALESVETARRLDITKPIYVRIDGRGFSRFTRGLNRPFDERLSRAMIETTKHLVKATSAMIGYTQSDEISLGYHVDTERNPLADMFFSGKVQKLTSVLASMATAAFTRAILDSPDEEFRAYAMKLPHFDARVFNVPDADELANAFLWRELDATRNAVSMAAFAQFSHSQLHKVSCQGMRAMLADAGIDFEAYPDFFKRGTFIRAQKVEKPVSELPEGAWKEWQEGDDGIKLGQQIMIESGSRTVLRTVVEPIAMPPLLTVTNRPQMIYGAAPEVRLG